MEKIDEIRKKVFSNADDKLGSLQGGVGFPSLTPFVLNNVSSSSSDLFSHEHCLQHEGKPFGVVCSLPLDSSPQVIQTPPETPQCSGTVFLLNIKFFKKGFIYIKGKYKLKTVLPNRSLSSVILAELP